MQFVLERKALSVAAAATFAFAWLYASDLAKGFAADFSRVFQWAGITVVLIANPLLGGLARTSLDRCLGSLLGALVAMTGAYISTHGAFYVPLTAVFIYGSHVVGDKLDAAYSAKIAMLSFILVAGSCLSSSQQYWRIALVRLAGIVLGVFLAQVASITIYSKTHSDTAIARLRTSLRCTAELCETAWLAWHLTDKPHVPTFLTAPAEELKAAVQQASQVQPGPKPGMPPAQAHRSSDVGESIGSQDAVSPATPGPAQVRSPTQTTLHPHIVVPNRSSYTQLAGALGSTHGEKVLGILQVEDRSVLPVTPNLLAQISEHAQRRAVDKPPSEAHSNPDLASTQAKAHNDLYQAISAPELASAVDAEPPTAGPAATTSHSDSGSPRQTGHDMLAPQPPTLHKLGFGSMQDLVNVSRSTSLDSHASAQHHRSTPQPSPLSQAVPASPSPLAQTSAATSHSAPGAEGRASLPATPRLPLGQGKAITAADDREQQGRSDSLETVSEREPVEVATEVKVDQDTTSRTRNHTRAGSSTNRDTVHFDSSDQDGTSWAPPPPKVASVAAWLDAMPSWPQHAQAAMPPARKARPSPGSAVGRATTHEASITLPPPSDVEPTDKQGTIYQAWRRVLGHQAAPAQQPNDSAAPGTVPALHKLGASSVFNSAVAAPVSPIPSTQTSSTQPGGRMETPQPLAYIYPGPAYGSRRLSSIGVSTQSPSPHQTRITLDTAISHRSVESVPASEIQWLLQAMGSALEASDLTGVNTAHSMHAAAHGRAAPATPEDGSGSKGRASARWGLPSSLGPRSQGASKLSGAREPSAAPAAAAAPACEAPPDTSGAFHSVQVPVEHVLGWDEEKQALWDRRCEDLLMTILQEASKAEADVEGTMGEALVQLGRIQMFLPRPISSINKLQRNHMPRAAIENLVSSIRITARILWALHTTLRQGFTRDMVMLLKHTYPAALMSDLRHFSIASLYDVVNVFPAGFVTRSAANIPPENLRRFISTVEALVTISRTHAADSVDELSTPTHTPTQVSPKLGLSSPSLPSVQTNPFQAEASPVAGPVAEGALDAAGLRLSGADHTRLSMEGTTPSPPQRHSSVGRRRSTESRMGVVPVAQAPLPRATTPDAEVFGLEGPSNGPVQVKRMQRRTSGALFASVFGRSTIGSSLHRQASKVSRLSWETAYKHGNEGPRWTQALQFPTTVEGFLARVRWQAFQQDVTELAEQLMRLHQTAKNVMLHLPGPAGVADPMLVPDADLW